MIERYRQMGIRRLRTDESGAITVVLGAELHIAKYRTEHPRY
ncbi:MULTISPECIES: hypothetical protein [unclassified Janthinobacterium]|nr:MULTISPECIES: hypothetical protein [unclassified Janthinobacterium]MEC5162278.1 beta-lactamase superfamily II metal-dependent hydrolase [Janthinobacterium sp. CG_S6]